MLLDSLVGMNALHDRLQDFVISTETVLALPVTNLGLLLRSRDTLKLPVVREPDERFERHDANERRVDQMSGERP